MDRAALAKRLMGEVQEMSDQAIDARLRARWEAKQPKPAEAAPVEAAPEEGVSEEEQRELAEHLDAMG